MWRTWCHFFGGREKIFGVSYLLGVDMLIKQDAITHELLRYPKDPQLKSSEKGQLMHFLSASILEK